MKVKINQEIKDALGAPIITGATSKLFLKDVCISIILWPEREANRLAANCLGRGPGQSQAGD